MGTFIDLSGHRFNKLRVLRKGEPKVGPSGRAVVRWDCVCDCGNTTIVSTQKLKSGHTTSCGCVMRSRLIEAQTTHGMVGTRTYRIWNGMRTRCNNPNDPKFHLYGGAGVRITERWDNFANFFADMGEAPAGMSIDRFPDRDGDYAPGNCRWATPSEQNNNLRTTRFFIWNGERRSLTQWCDHLGISRGALNARLFNGQSFDYAVSALLEKKK